MTDKELMNEALRLAGAAFAEGEVPVGAVVALGGKIVGRGRNKREKERNALCHAEIEAIDEACRTLGGWRLWECDLYVTLEPCPMCAGAAVNARVKKIIFGAYDEKNGACGSVANIPAVNFSHKPEVCGGFCEAECAAMLKDFFAGLRRETACECAEAFEAEKSSAKRGMFIAHAEYGTVTYDLRFRAEGESPLEKTAVAELEKLFTEKARSKERGIILFTAMSSGEGFKLVTAGLTHRKVSALMCGVLKEITCSDAAESTKKEAAAMLAVIDGITTEEMIY